MEQVYSLLKAFLSDPKRVWTTVAAAVAALAAAIGVERVEPKELIRPLLSSAGFFEVSAGHRQSEALIQRIQDIDRSDADHPLVRRLRTLSIEGKSPFQGREHEIRLRRSTIAPAGYFAAVCPDSHLLYTYLQSSARSPEVGLVILRVERADTCGASNERDEVRVNPGVWGDLVGGTGADTTTLKMDVLLHFPGPRRGSG
jgi:hypothetical protein